MRRWAFHLAAGFSLLLLAGSVMAWLRSTAGTEGVMHYNHERLLLMCYSNGRFAISAAWFPESSDASGFKSYRNQSGVPYEFVAKDNSIAGFRYLNRDKSSLTVPAWQEIEHLTFLYVPIWFVTAICSVLPIWWFVAYHKRRTREGIKHWVCVNCGYDLRGFQGDACPECGTDRAPENKLIRMIEAQGWTVGRVPFLTEQGERYRLDAWRTNENPSGAYEGQGDLHTAEAGDMMSAATKLAAELGVGTDHESTDTGNRTTT